MDNSTKNYQKATDYLKLSLKGFCMGIADVIPGISGGTIAFIFGIYEDLIMAIKSFDMKFLRLLCTLKFKEAFNHAHWKFLSALFLGIVTAVFTFAKIISWLLHNKPVLLHAFFFGLIFATVPIIARSIKKWNASFFILCTISAICMFYLVGLVPINTPETMWFLFFSGALAICAMILPGISGAFILVLIGKYQYILEAVTERNFPVLIIVALGCAVGILTFVRVLNWLLTKYHGQTIAVLTGLVLGSLRKIWPWKETLQSITTSKGKVIPIEQVNFLPSQFSTEVIYAIGLCLCGFLVALLLSLADNKNNNDRGKASSSWA